ncbi:hypothetical protein E4U35_004278 [Claviceps purpurea]|nr:hypothetical protein E4U11_000149 [Claviceps purpurea]KAG6168839.1 hypothetical protein E4U27_007696 [Claviceps purpurea]KAG6203449.1 hypothetical protein E4U35_004278 [Claviceps purpurea]KAG6254170.1 hypothetical protein E4U49_007355 [Claviceps purpurea]KAG6267439.1 hypothetical protein E4U47_005273 [Claviceps purpurea]
MSSLDALDALDAQSQAQIHAVIQQAVQEGLAATERRDAQSQAQIHAVIPASGTRGPCCSRTASLCTKRCSPPGRG